MLNSVETAITVTVLYRPMCHIVLELYFIDLTHTSNSKFREKITPIDLL